MSKSRIPGGPMTILAVGLLVIALGGWLTVEWTVNYHWVPEGHSMRLRYKGPPLPIPFLGIDKAARPGEFAATFDESRAPQELGVLEQMVGPGRHFYCPLWWECEIVPDVVIKPGQVGVVTSKMGKAQPDGGFLVDGDIGQTEYNGILRKVLSPGRYRINPYAYKVEVVETQSIQSGGQTKKAGWVEIPTGYVGVVTNLTSNPITSQAAGIQHNVLPPGIYPINGKEQQIDIVNIGYRGAGRGLRGLVLRV